MSAALHILKNCLAPARALKRKYKFLNSFYFKTDCLDAVKYVFWGCANQGGQFIIIQYNSFKLDVVENWTPLDLCVTFH